MYSTHVDTQQIRRCVSILLHPRIEEHAAATLRTELVQIPLHPKSMVPKCIFTTLDV
jgi:hypothetical protein